MADMLVTVTGVASGVPCNDLKGQIVHAIENFVPKERLRVVVERMTAGKAYAPRIHLHHFDGDIVDALRPRIRAAVYATHQRHAVPCPRIEFA